MTDWVRELLDRACDRVTEVEREVGTRFPLFADGGSWTTTARGSWTGGFWAGLLALRASATGVGDPVPVRRRLDVWAEADTVCRGMVFWYGSGGERSGLHAPEPSTSDVARRLAECYDERIGAIPWGTALAPDGPPIRPDGAAGVVPLLAAHGYDEVARRHLETHLGCGEVAWRRGSAWLLLSCVDGDRRFDGFDRRFRTLADQWTAPDPDASATAIAAVALLKSDNVRTRATGERLLREAARGTAEYDGRTGLRVVWGDFFMALGAALLLGLANPDHW
ncbi:hypothetical protein AB0I60_00225 [Actinosynnema sp. NPDC050436]|uniref:hypothetical protein n=1 Tax=Actinosynnema sp. NPDC050436 TaxID=3155659 RepID=UPI0033CF09A1